MIATYNGIPAGKLRGAAWLKSHHSNSQGTCVEMAMLPDGQIALRRSPCGTHGTLKGQR